MPQDTTICPKSPQSAIGKATAERLAGINAVALRRAVVADGWLPRCYKTVRLIYRHWIYDIADRCRAGTLLAVGADDTAILAERLYAETRPLEYGMIADGYAWTAQEFGESSGRSGVPDVAAKADVIVEVPEWEDFLQTADMSQVEEHIKAVSTKAADTRAGSINRIFVDGAVAHATPAEIAATLLGKGIVQSDRSAVLWARTESIWAYNEGAHQQYIAHGVPIEEWVVTHDDATCEFCASMDGVKIRTQDNFLEAGDKLTGTEGRELETAFAVGHPTLHPDCRCIIVPGVL